MRSLSGKGRISERNIRDAAQEVRAALLDADVAYEVAEQFCEEVVRDALGREVTQSLKPGQEFIGVVNDRLIALMTPVDGERPTAGIVRVSPPPTVIMLCGLQGSGKTTTAGKIAGYLKKRGRSVMLAAADLQRPAAVDQLETVAKQVERDLPGGASVSFYSEPDKVAAYGDAVGVAVDVCRRAVKAARKQSVDTIILDTAGRLHIDDDLMGELTGVRSAVSPHMILLVIDAMAGQDAVRSAKAFHDRLAVDGVVLSKFDSDARGGAALTVARVTGAPLLFVGTGEKLDALEEFHPERAAGRILGMGDVLSLVEKAHEEVSEEEAEALQEKMLRGEMTLDDFLKQLRALRRMGPMKQLLGMLPGVGASLKNMQFDDAQLNRIEGVIHSMTPRERRDVGVINHSRRKRIALGSGANVAEVSRLTKQFEALSKMTKQLSGMGALGKVGALRKAQAQASAGAIDAPNFKPKIGTRTVSPKSRYRSKRNKRR